MEFKSVGTVEWKTLNILKCFTTLLLRDKYMIMMWMKKSVQIEVYLSLSELNKTSSLLWKAKVRVVIWSPLTSGSMTTWRWRTLTKVRGVRVRWPWAPRGEAPTTTAQWTTCRPTTRTEVRTQVLFKALISLNLWIIIQDTYKAYPRLCYFSCIVKKL